MTKEEQIEEVYKAIESDCSLSDLRSGALNLVRGNGNIHTRICFIGEAPGKNEDEQGIPFIGKSGKILEGALLKSGMERKDVFITNIVKYRPPKNRPPTTEEKRNFLPYLIKELHVLKPRLVCTLGRHSTGCFIDFSKFSDVAGKIFEQTEMKFMPCYHPAATIYNQKLRGDFENIISSAVKFVY